ncbi:MAG: hypothetical protein JNK60_17230, partial [Acidobacteria bacterium]|nr:hypothetical protein [Acidobacteriota bacterium]
MIRSSFSRLAVALTAGFLAASPVHADTTLGAGQYRLVGASFDVTPATQTVPVGIPATVRTVFSGQIAGLSENGLRVAAELSGPGVPSPVTLSTVPGGDLLVPALSVKGDYRLDNIRLTDGARTLAPAATPTVHIVVSDVLITQVSSRALTTEELLARGVILTDANYKAFSFAVGLAIQGRTITIELPTMVETRNGYMPMGSPRVDIGNAAEGFTPPRIVAIPLEPIPGAGLPADREEFVEESAAPTPVFGFLVFPGNIRFLNQFFSVVLMVQNGAPQGSTLALSNLTTTVSLPTTSLRLSKTIPSVPDGAPVPVRNAGPDEVLGTADDVTVLVAQATGSAEFVTEGLRVGTHEVECLIEATLSGLANQPARQLSGRARGSVVVRDPSFSMSFNHPDVVRDGEEYELRVTVANTSTVQANQVTVAIDAASLSGVEALDFLPGVNPNAALGDLPAGSSALVKFRMRARRTGRVVASAFTSDGAVTGSVVLRTAVTNDGTPLSPDSFVFPRFLSSLPPAVVDPATALIGIAHGLATMDPTAPGQNGCNVDSGGLAIDCLAPFADGIVQERVVDLVEAARRASLNQPVPSAVADVAFAWLGSELASPGFDKVRRRNNHGASLDAGIAASLSEHAAQQGVNGLTTLLLDAAVANAPVRDAASPLAGPAFVVLEGGSPSNPAARLVLADPATTLATGFVVSENAARHDLPYSSVYPLAGAGGVEVGLLGRTPTGGYLVHIQGRAAGTVRATAFFPDGQGGFRKLDLGNVAIQPGSMATVQVVPGATSALLTSSVEAARTVTAVAAIPSPFAGIAAVQDLEASPLGRAVSVIFNRRTALASQDLTRYRLPGQKPNGTAYDRNVLGAFRQTDTRRVVVVAEATISPVRPGFLEGSSIPAELSATWTGSLPIVARLQAEGGTVEGRVIGPEGTPLPNAPVQLTESATDDLTGTVFQAATSVTRTDGTGNYFFDFVRKQDGKPFRVDSFDGSTGSKGYAVGQIRTDRSTVQVDIVLQGRGRVQGRVLAGPEQPLAGVIVRCSSVNDPNFRLALISRADGTFGFDSVPVGTVQLQAEDPLTNRTSYATVSLTAPGHVVSSDLLLTQLPRTSLRGTVLHGGNGQPYANVYVAGYGASGEYFGVRLTGADGAFAFSTVPVGNVRLELFDLAVSAGAVLVQPLTLVADQPAEVTVTVPETVRHFGSAAGFVRKVVNGAQQPAAGVVVYERDSGIRTTTAADGSFLLDGLEVGTRQITALVPASGRTTSVSVGILENQPANVLLLFPDFTLGTIAGVVTDQTGARRAGAKVEIWRADGLSTIAEAISATDGS